MENPQVTLHQSTTLNPATLLPVPTGEKPLHDCMYVLEHQYSCRPDLTDQPIPNAHFTWYTDGSSFVINGIRYAGYATVDQESTIESAALPKGSSAQLAELWALTRALELATDKMLNVYTDSKYAFLTIQAHAAIYKERGFTDASGKVIQCAPMIKRLIRAARLPRALAVIHCPGHQKGDSATAKGNRRADEAAKAAAMMLPKEPEMTVYLAKELQSYVEKFDPTYTPEGCMKAEKDLHAELKQGWYVLSDGRLVVPRSLAWPLVQELHQQTHVGKTALAQKIESSFYVPNVHAYAAKVTLQCSICAQVNARQGPSLPQGRQPSSYLPMDYLMVDFTDMPRSNTYRAMLVFNDTYSGWIEAFPTHNKQAIQVARILIKELIPRFGCPSTLSSDNGPEFIHMVNKHLSEAAGIKWRYHCAFHPESGGKIERANRSIKQCITKLCLETHLPWTQVLPMALYILRTTPRTRFKLSPFELLYG